MRRLWISSMEDSAIKEGFSRLKNGEEYDALFASALCRAKADWLIGINATRLFSVLSVSYTHLDVYKRQEAGLMSSVPLGENLIPIQRGLTTSSTAIFIPFKMCIRDRAYIAELYMEELKKS